MNIIGSEPPFGAQQREGDLAELLGDSSLLPLWWRAERLGAPSAWWQHVPFAHWLVAATTPRCLVELGTHAGVSYAAFCQAVVRAGTGTRCYAVDTWMGDAQAGEYGEEVYEDFRRYNEENHANFSTLLRMTFDEALGTIADGSVDLLHIDGLHTYEAVRHDYEQWRPKLTERGVVLFHDITEHQGEFGVWRLWSELKRQHPCFEFLHGHGLGVLAVGDEVPAAVARLCAAREQSSVAAVRSLFFRLGERWEYETRERMASDAIGKQVVEADRQAKAAKGHFDALEAELRRVTEAAAAERGAALARAESNSAMLAQTAERAAALERGIEQARGEVDRAGTEIRRLEAAQAVLLERMQAGQRRLREAASREDQVEAALAEARDSAARAWEAVRDANEQTRLVGVASERAKNDLALARGERDALLQSTIWKTSWPLRAVVARMPRRLRRAPRKAAGLAWRAARRLTGGGSQERHSAALLTTDGEAAPPPILLCQPVQPAGSAEPDPVSAPTSRAEAGVPRVVWISGEAHIPGHVYRVKRPAAAAAALGIRATVLRLEEVCDRIGDIEAADIVVIWRAAWDNNVALALDTAHRLGARIIFDVDDLMFDPSLAKTDMIDGIRTQDLTEDEVRAHYARVQATMGRAALCLATTEELAGHMRAMGKPALVLPNGFDEECWQRSRLAARQRAAAVPDGLVRLGYAGGSRTHQRDFAVCAEAVAAVLRAHPQCRLVLFRSPHSGQALLDLDEFPCLDNLQAQIEWRETVALEDLPDELARFDINLAPLQMGNMFAEAKSELKFFEAALVGVVTVASPTGPFRRAVTPGRTGFLAATSNEWAEHLTALIGDPGLRRRVATAALLSVLWRYGPERRALDIASILDLHGPPRAAAAAFASRTQRHHRPPVDLVIPDHEIMFHSDQLLVADVTIVVPLYNYAHTVVEALDSVAGQDVADLDLVVIDDRSTDGSLDVVLQWMGEH